MLCNYVTVHFQFFNMNYIYLMGCKNDATIANIFCFLLGKQLIFGLLLLGDDGDLTSDHS